MGKITAILIGAGLRGGHVYASYALEHPDEFQIVAVAEPDIARRKQIAALQKINMKVMKSYFRKNVWQTVHLSAHRIRCIMSQ